VGGRKGASVERGNRCKKGNKPNPAVRCTWDDEKPQEVKKPSGSLGVHGVESSRAWRAHPVGVWAAVELDESGKDITVEGTQ